MAHNGGKKCMIIFIAGLLSRPISLRDNPALYSHNRNNNSHHPSREIPVLIRISYGHAVTPIFTADFMHTRQKTTISPVHQRATTFSTFFRIRLLPRNPSKLAIQRKEGRVGNYRSIARISKREVITT